MTVLEIVFGCFIIVGVLGVVAIGLAPRVARRVFVHQRSGTLMTWPPSIAMPQALIGRWLAQKGSLCG